MSEEKSFPEFYIWFLSLSNHFHLKRYVKELAEHQFIHFSISTDYKTINYSDRNLETGDWEDGTIDVDKHLMGLALPYISNPPQKIIPFLESSGQLSKLLTSTRVSYNSITDDKFYKPFELYRTAVVSLGNKLQEISDHWGKKIKKKRVGEKGIKSERSYELKTVLDEIKKHANHKDAIKFLEKEYPGFEWIASGKFFTAEGKMIKSNIALALEQVGKIQWETDYPGKELIRTNLLK